jgi:hypothetical protein
MITFFVCNLQVVGSKGNRNSGWIGGGFAVNGTVNTLVLPVNYSWNIFDQEPYSVNNKAFNDGTGTVQATDTTANIGGAGCTLSATAIRLGAEASGIDYSNRYIKLTSGACMNRWTKITSYSGASYDGLVLTGSSTTVLKLPDDAFASTAANYFVGATVCIVSGTGSSSCRVAASSIGTAGLKSVTVSPAFTAVDATSRVRINGITKCATLPATWTDGSAGCVAAAGDTYKIMGGWRLVVTDGTCAGQYSRLANFQPYATGGGVVTLDKPFSNTPQTNGDGPFGETVGDFGEGWNFNACTGPDNTTKYALVPERKAPGCIDSMDDSFRVRWAGFVMPSSTTQYTFQTIMPGANNGLERIRLWVDNVLLIDQVRLILILDDFFHVD